jgi:DNA-directed RNA polymerase specialized sigma subunit
MMLLVIPIKIQEREEDNTMNKTMNKKTNSTKVKAPRIISKELKEKKRRREVIRAFFRRYKTSKELLKKLKAHYVNITAKLDAPEQYRVRRISSKDPAHTTSGKFALMDEKEALEKKMKELERVVEDAEFSLTMIYERDRQIIETYLFADSPRGIAEKLSKKFCLCVRRIHQLHTEALEKIYSDLDTVGYFERDDIGKADGVVGKACGATGKACDASNIHIASKGDKGKDILSTVIE